MSSIIPLARREPVHGGWHSLSVRTNAFGTRSVPRRSACVGKGGGGGGGGGGAMRRRRRSGAAVLAPPERGVHLLPHEAAREHLARAAHHRIAGLEQHEARRPRACAPSWRPSPLLLSPRKICSSSTPSAYRSGRWKLPASATLAGDGAAPRREREAAHAARRWQQRQRRRPAPPRGPLKRVLLSTRASPASGNRRRRGWRRRLAAASGVHRRSSLGTASSR